MECRLTPPTAINKNTRLSGRPCCLCTSISRLFQPDSMNRRQLQAIIDNPPPKSPYFKLPSVLNIVFEAEDVLKPKILLRRAPNTVTSTWGMARKMTEATKTSFLANLLQFCSIDFDAMAKGNSIASGKQM